MKTESHAVGAELSTPLFAIAGWALPLLVAAALRLRHASEVVLGDDEFHAVRVALGWPSHGSLTSYYYTPLNAFYRTLALAGVELSELVLRAPVAASSLALVLIGPWLVRSLLGAPTATSFAWLAALSPILVCYATMVRPYAIVATLSFFAVVVFFRWLERPSVGRAIAYVALSIATILFHVLVAAFVLAPLGFGLVTAIRNGGGKSFRPIALVAMAMGIALGVALIPAWKPLVGLFVKQLHAPSLIDSTTLAGVALLQAGTSDPLAALAFWTGAAGGLVALIRRRPLFATYTVTLVASQLVAIIAISPRLSHVPLVFNRYAIAVLPIALLWVAVALAEIGRAAARPRLTLAVITAAFAGGLFLMGPLSDPAFRNSPFLHHNDLIEFTRQRQLPNEDLVPFFYRSPDHTDRTIVEFPWDGTWQFARPYLAYQVAGGHRVLLSPISSVLGADHRLALRTIVSPEPKVLLASSGTHLVIHRDLAAEEKRVRAALDLRVRHAFITPPGIAGTLRDEAMRLAARTVADWGPPDTEDDAVLVWDLRRIRATAAGAR